MSDNRPNILFIVSDEHSFRFQGHLGRDAGGEDVVTPNLDRLSEQATQFRTAYCAVPLCVPSRISLLTGLEAQKSGAIDNRSVLDPNLDTIPKMLARAGYETALIGKMHFQGNLQFHGFQHRPYGDLAGGGTHQYEDDIWHGDRLGTADKKADGHIGDNLASRTNLVGRTRVPESQICDRIIAEESLGFLRDYAAAGHDKPWFLCASFSRPHFPLTSPPRFADQYKADTIDPPFVAAHGASFEHPVSRAIRDGFAVSGLLQDEMMTARAAYYACVSYFDEILGDFLNRLTASGLLENTIIIYTSDHGEMAGELGTWWKSGWYEGCCRVPLMISTPEQRYGSQPATLVNTPVSLLDLFPTMMSIAGGTTSATLSGRDLGPALAGTALPDCAVVCDHLNARWGRGTEFRSIRLGSWKYVGFREGYDNLLFDLSNDPSESRNLADSGLAIETALSAHFDALDFSHIDDWVEVKQPQLRADFPMSHADATPNQYLLGDRRVFEGGTTLYSSRMVTADAAHFFADWPKDRNA